MDKNKLMEQLRKAVREVIQEELGKSSYDAKSGISTTALTKDGKPVGYIKHKKTDTGLVAGGRIGPKAAKAATTEEKTTINIPVAALPSYKKGQQPTVINPQTGEEEIESDVSSWAKALERRFGHLKPGESASLKGDPKDVKKPVKESNTIIDKMKEKGVPTSDDKDVYKHVFGKERPRGKGSKSVEDKARDMGQMDMFTLEEWIGMMEEAGYSLEEGAMDTLRHAGRQVRDTVKGIGRAGKAVLAARRGGDAKSMMGLIGHDLKRAYQSPAVVHSTDYDGKRQYTDHGPGAANILRRLRDYGQDTRLFFGERKPKKFRHGADYTINQSPEEIERDATPRPSGALPSRLAHQLQWTKERPDTSTNHYSTSESYTLEEWIGMMEEAGYKVNKK